MVNTGFCMFLVEVLFVVFLFILHPFYVIMSSFKLKPTHKMKRNLGEEDGDVDVEFDLALECFKRMKVEGDASDDDAELLWDENSGVEPSEGSIYLFGGLRWIYCMRLQLWWCMAPRQYWSSELGWGTW